MINLIAEIIATFIENLTGMYWLLKLNNQEKINIVKASVIVTPLTTIIILLNIIRPYNYLNIFLVCIYFLVIARLFYHLDYKKTLSAVLVYLNIIYFIDFITAIELGIIAGKYNYIEEILLTAGMQRIFFLLIDKCLLIASVYIISKYFFSFFTTSVLLLLAAFSTIFTFLLQFITLNASNIHSLLNWILCGAITIIAVVLFIFRINLLKQKKLSNLLAFQYTSVRNTYMQLLEQNKERDRVYHDIKNHLLCIRQLINNKKYDECVNYINVLQKPLGGKFQIVWTGCEMFDFILNYKKSYAESRNITFITEVEFANISSIKDEDICIIMGNLLDNAIEANEKIMDKEKWIKLKVNRIDDILLIHLSNALNTHPDIRKGRLISDKTNDGIHGLGLKNVKLSVEKYDGVLEYHVEDERFLVDITMFIN